jgi:hypothetical protein
MRILNDSFAVDVNAIQAGASAVEVGLRIERSERDARSYNIGLFGLDASFVYNAGYYAVASDADEEFMLTAVHELGHSVLMEFDGMALSWAHKGSSGLDQTVLRSTPGYPQTGEVDLMKYYDATKFVPSRSSIVAATRAAEQDVKRLLWLRRLSF